MEVFWKATAVALLTVILGIAVGKTEKDLSAVLSVAACCIIMTVALQYLSDVAGFLWRLGNSQGCNNPFIGTLLKVSGIALVTELSSLFSADAGNSSLGKAMQILGNAVILFLSLPVFEGFLSMIQELIGIL